MMDEFEKHVRPTPAGILEQMVAFSEGNMHDIDHLLRVWAWAKTIGEGEGLDAQTRLILEIAAITHDIACPLCREKYGNTNGKYQEVEGGSLVRAFLRDTGLSAVEIDRVAFLVEHHHTFTGVEGIDWQILLEADYLANAAEKGNDRETVRSFMDKYMKTDTGKRLCRALFCL